MLLPSGDAALTAMELTPDTLSRIQFMIDDAFDKPWFDRPVPVEYADIGTFDMLVAYGESVLVASF